MPEGTRLIVDQDMAAEFEESMQEAWPRAFALLKELCEDLGGGEALLEQPLG